MTASKGREAWTRHFKGKGDQLTKIKGTSTAVFDQEGKRLSVPLTKGTDVTYVDNLSVEHPKDSSGGGISAKKVVAIKVGTETYFVDVNDVVKPGSVGAVPLQPQDFGLGGSTTLPNYISTLKSSIKGRQDIQGELEDYLIDLVEYYEKGIGGLADYDVTKLPMATIIKDFGETLGPIWCVKKGLSGKNLGVSLATNINIVSRGEVLKDYELINTNGTKLNISAKGDTASTNTLKPGPIMKIFRNNSNLVAKYSSTPQYQIISTLDQFGALEGPMRAASNLGYYRSQFNLISGTNFRNANSSFIPPEVQKAYEQMFLTADTEIKNKYLSGTRFTYRTIAWCYENFLINYSKKQTNQNVFTKLLNDVLNSELIVVKLSMSGTIPQFDVLMPKSGSINNVFLRQKNTKFGTGGEKLGFQL